MRPGPISSRKVAAAIVLALGMIVSPTLLSVVGVAGDAAPHLSADSAGSALSSLDSSRGPVAIPPIPDHRLGLNPPDAVNPTGFYSAEPAPMGIGDFGIGTGGNPYSYSTSEFLGNFSWKSLNLQENGDGDASITVQLNVVLQFVQRGTTYAYWIQNVGFIDTANGELSYENNIWNFSSTQACLNSTGVSGNGTVYPYTGCEGYYAVSPTDQPGGEVTMSSPGDFALLVRSYENAQGYPEVAFEYWDGVTRWFVTYDNVVWPWAKSPSADNGFEVDGSGYNPFGLFYDAEFTIGGPGGGASTEALDSTDSAMKLLFWNGHNFEAPPATWNFGSNTGESVSSIQSVFSSDAAGLPITVQYNGTARNATPAQAYDQNRVGELAISAPSIASGTVAIPGDTWDFVNDSATLTLVPGIYPVWVNSSSGDNYLGTCTVTADETVDVALGDTCGSGSSTPSVSTPTASASGADIGQSITFQSTLVSAGSGGDTYVWGVSPTGLGCGTSTTLTLSCTPTAAGTYDLSLTVTDSNGTSSTSGTLSFKVASDPTVGTPTASKSSVETGDTVTFTAAPSGGATPYTYSWSGLPTPCSGTTTATPKCTPATPGSYTVSVSVTDANGYSVASSGLSFSVDSGPSISVPTVSPSSSIDLGSSVTFSTSASGGSGSYTYSWSGLPTGCTSSSVTQLTCAPSAAGDFSITASVVDSLGGSATSAPLSFTVDTDPAVASPSASPSTVDLGHSVTFSADATGGSGGYTYTWSGLPAGCSPSSSAQISCTPSTLGTSSVTVAIEDSNGGTASSPALTFTVNSDPSMGALDVARSTVDAGQSLDFTATGISGGAAPYTYTWTGLPSGCASADSPTLTCTPSAAGSGSVTVDVTDASGVTISASVGFEVLSDPSVEGVSASQSSADVGQSVTFSAVGVSGGSGSYSYDWTDLPTGCSGTNSSSVVCVPTGPGTSDATVVVTDSNGFSVTRTLTFNVYADPSVGTPNGNVSTAVVGEAVEFSVSATGGYGSLTYVWSGLPAGCVGTNASTVSCRPSAAGSSEVSVTVTDANGLSARSPYLAFTVSGPVTSQSMTPSVFTGNFLLGALAALTGVFVVLYIREAARRRPPR